MADVCVNDKTAEMSPFIILTKTSFGESVLVLAGKKTAVKRKAE